ncbi:ABC transporter permease [Chitinophaga sp.]|uniref:ABC transporter permease n=1 Tax=Chitinophaga sp. TaxID=1869181 RepID=UPI002C8EAA8D|nr:ABC transporter permease [Chitinophaga sp.]HWV64274.1 ABC transporter permease [Chitinophaga sp.]
MFKSYFRAFLRNARNNMLSSVIIIAGFSISMAILIKILQIVFFEYGYDNFHENRNSIYRVVMSRYEYGRLEKKEPGTPLQMGPAAGELPGVEKWARAIENWPGLNVAYNNTIVRTNTFSLYVDSSFFDVFTFPLLRGSVKDLGMTNTVFISDRFAKRLFKEEDPLTKIINYDGQNLIVKGVFADPPSNSTLNYDILISLSSFPGLKENFNWKDNTILHLYLVLQDNVNKKSLENKLTRLHAANYNFLPQVKVMYTLQQMKDFHLKSADVECLSCKTANVSLINFLLVVAVIIVVISTINFINISFIKSLDRGKDIAMRKIMGAQRHQVFVQFMMESLILNLIGLIFAIGIIFLPFVDTFFELSYHTGDMFDGWHFLLILLIMIVVAVASSLLPAFVLSSFRPLDVFKKKLTADAVGIFLRNALIVVQFIFCIGLTAASMSIYKQFRFVATKDLGINLDNVIMVANPEEARPLENRSGDAFKNELMQDNGVINVTFSSYPGRPYTTTNIITPQNTDIHKLTRVGHIDPDFLNTYKVRLLAGRNLSAGINADILGSLLVNESFVKSFGYKSIQEAVGKFVRFDNEREYKIVGVIGDYNQVSLKENILPACFRYYKWSSDYFSIRIKPGELNKTIASVRKAFNKIYPGYGFEYKFLGDAYNAQYSEDRKFGKWVVVLTVLAMLLSGIGVWAVYSYYMKKKARSFAIRRILGADVGDILLSNYRKLIKLILIACLVSFPVTYFTIESWLGSYAYAIGIGLWFILVPLMIVLVLRHLLPMPLLQR